MRKINDAVFFLDKNIVVKSMLMSEFEALLDGFVEVPEFSAKAIKGIYVQLDDVLNIHGLVCFVVEFSRDGFIHQDWNMRLEQLANDAEPGFDFGFGPFRTVCRSRSPLTLASHLLWEPDTLALQHLVEAIQTNSLGLDIIDPVQLKPSASYADFNDASIDIPTLEIPDLTHDEFIKGNSGMIDKKSMNAKVAMYSVKFEKMKKDYEQLKQYAEKRNQAIKLQARDQIKKICEEYESELEQKNMALDNAEKRLQYEQNGYRSLKEKYVNEVADYQFQLSQVEQKLLAEHQNHEEAVSNDALMTLTETIDHLKDCVSLLQVEIHYRNEQIALLQKS